MEQLGIHWPEFDEIWYMCFSRKLVEKVEASLKSDRNNGWYISRK
jgi:hypothetical protein